MDSTGSILCCLDGGICRINGSVAVGKKSCSAGCVSGYGSAFYIGVALCCKECRSYAVKAGVIAACAVGRISCDIYIIKSYIGS